jgi:hypothetical protein
MASPCVSKATPTQARTSQFTRLKAHHALNVLCAYAQTNPQSNQSTKEIIMRHTSIKEINLAKLRILRDEFAERAKNNERKAKAIRNAEEAEMTWEMVKLGIKPLRQGRLFK